MKRPVQLLADFLKESNLTIAFAESMTCGMAAHILGTVSGTSDFFKGSIVCYDETVKMELLGINKKMIEKHTAESQKVTDALTKNLKKLITADIYASVTGLSAPGGSETAAKPVGTVFYCAYYKNKYYRKRKLFKGAPLVIKKKACDELFKFILKLLKR
jgi:nicotinamide-nucleotide amidase